MLSSILFAADPSAPAGGIFNSSGFVALVSTAGALGVAYIVNVLAKRRTAAKHPDRMATIFDGYEKLITQQQEEIGRKSSTITTLEDAINRLELQLEETRRLLEKARSELAESKEHNINLKAQLDVMRKEYKHESQPAKS